MIKMKYSFRPQGVCSRNVTFEIEDGIIKNVSFEGGCNGNLKGIAALAEGKKAEDVIASLSGIRCGFKQTSCPDQFAKALETALKGE
jgi:uncharacterized protein (TIGR03905 family)